MRFRVTAMTIEDHINGELARLHLLALNAEQVQCLHHPHQLEDAVGMLSDLRDRCGVRLPMPKGTPIAGPFQHEDEASDVAQLHAAEFQVVAVEVMATDDSRSTGSGDEFYVTGFAGAHAALALAEQDHWAALWVAGRQRSLDA